ncbi:MAG: aconitase family protein, partial [Armatimonadota bacterium]|nr:aconitase family protein [Armatimonadota bacterium]
SAGVSPGSRQVLEMIARNGALADLIASGVRILEAACGPCIGMGQAPCTNGVSVRTFNRNFEGRSGTPSGKVYLASVEVAAAAILTGKLTDPRKLGEPVKVTLPEKFTIDDSMIISPAEDAEGIEIFRGPNIKPLPIREPLPENLSGKILIKVGDNITTDHIMPAGSKILPLRSNIPAISEHIFEGLDPSFPSRAKSAGGGFIVGGENYGQGSSREHAALAPMYLGVKAVIAKSFARIHKANLVNFGILPLVFSNPSDYDNLDQDDELEIKSVRDRLSNNNPLILENKTKRTIIEVQYDLTPRQVSIILSGGMLSYMKATGRQSND